MNEMKIRNEEYAKQLVIFDGLQFGDKIGKDIRYHPSDIDLVIELIRRQGLLLLAEFKHESAPALTDGQRIMMESIAEIARPEYCVVCLHLVHRGNGDEHGNIIAKDATIEQWYSNRTGVWTRPDHPMTLGDYIKSCFSEQLVKQREAYIRPFTQTRAEERKNLIEKLKKVIAAIVIVTIGAAAVPLGADAQSTDITYTP